ncbi:titin homolog [Montipora capricornis]|uniref:titin homolog n=1 Tax=Montipora capricornis TaxID=246305 RepID=UPI0035F14E1F
MAELGTQRVVLFSSPHKMVEKADGEITQSYSIENRNVLQSALDSGSDTPRTEISFKVSCNESLDDSGGSSPRESTQVIWTYHTLSGASTEVAVTSKPLDTAETEIEENSRRRHNKKIDGDVGETSRSKRSFMVYQRENISQTPTLGEMKKAKYSAIQFENPAYKPKKQGKNQEDGNSSIHAPENAAKSGHKTSYTYKIQEGVAILQHVEKKPKVDDKPISETSESEHKYERKRTINKVEDIVKDDIPGSSTGVESTTLDKNPINGPDGAHFQEQTKRIQREGHTKATTTYSSPEAALKPELSFRKLSNQKIKTFEASPNGKHLSASIAKTDSTVPFILPPRAKIRNSSEWITYTTSKEEAIKSWKEEGPSSKLSIEKIRYYQKHDSLPNITLHIHSKSRRTTVPGNSSDTSSADYGVVSAKEDSEHPKTQNWTSEGEDAHGKKPTLNVMETAQKPRKLLIPTFKSTQDQQSDKVDNDQIALTGKRVIPDFSEKNRSTATQEQPQSLKVNKINAEQWITQTIQHEVPKTEELPQTNKLSAEKMQFLQNKETEKMETAYVSSPGKVLIPDFNLKGSCNKDEEILPPSQPKSNNTEEWITPVTKQEEVQQEPALASPKFSVEKIQFPDKHDEEENDRPHRSPPGKIVIPDFNQESSSKKEQPPLKIPAKLNAEQWITTTIKQADQRSDLPSPTKKLSIEKMQFLQGQEVQRDDNVGVSRPGKLVIPDLPQESSVVQVKTTSPPPKQRITEECITQTTKQEVESDLPFSVEKVSLEKIESTQDQQSDKVDYGKIAFPGKLIIPDFSENNRSKATQEQPQSLKVNKINAEQWITQTIQHEVPKTEELPQTNKLSVEKMQFLQNKEAEKMETAYVSSPGKVLIPDFNLKGSCNKDEEILPPSQPKSNNTEEWITPVTKQEEVQQEPALASPKFSVEKIQFPDKHEEGNDRPHKSPAGKIVIPDFNQESSSKKEQPPLKIPAKLNAEQWITTTIKQADQRSDLPSPTKKLSIEKMQFLQGQEVQRDDNVGVSRPGKLVIPDLTQESSVVQVKTASPPPKQRITEECITQTTKQEVESDLPFSVEKVSLEKIESTQDQQSDKVDYGKIAFPGKLVIPDFSEKNRSTATQEQPQSLKVNKINAEQWITQTIQHEVPKTEELPQTNKLSVEKMQFLQNKETEKMETAYVSSPGKVLIPDFNLKGSCNKDEEILPPSQPKSNNTEEWITPVTKQEEVQQEPALASPKFSVEKIQFPDKHEEGNDRPHKSPAGKIVIPDFNQESSSKKEQPPLKIPAKLNAEQWITTTIKQADQRSDLPSPTKKLSIEKMQFLQGQEVQRDDNVGVSRPGKLVIPDLTQESSVVQVKTASPPPKQRITEECITQTTKQEVESDLPFSVEKVSLEKIESTQDQQSDKVDYGKIAFPGKLIIPDFSEKNRSPATQEQPQSLKVNKINAEQWITQTIQHEVPKTEELPQTNKLSVEKMQFLQNKEAEKMETAYVSSPGKVRIPDFNLKGSCNKDEEILPPSQPKSNNTEEWITPVTKQEEVQQEPALASPKFSVEKIQFPDKHEEEGNDRPHKSPPGKIVIPDFNQESSSKKEQPPLKIPAKLNAEQWITTTIKQADQRSDLPSPTKKLSIEKMQFLQGQEVQRDDNVGVSRPGKLVIPDLTQESSVVQVKSASPPPKQRIAEQCITQTTKQEVESDLPFSVEKVSLEKIESTQDQQSDKVDYGKIAFPGKLIIPDFSEKNRSPATQEQPQSLKVNKINAEQWITQTIQHEVPKTEELPQTNKLSVEKMQFLQNKETEKMETAYVSSPGKVLIPDFNLKGSCNKDEEILPPSQPKSNNTEEWITPVTKQEEVQQEPALASPKFSVEKIQFPDKHEEEGNDRPHKSPPGKIVIPDFNQESSSKKEQPPLKIPAKLNAEQWITTTIKQADQRSDLPSPTKKLSIEKMQFLQGQEVQRDDNVGVSRPGKLVIPDLTQESSVVQVKSASPPPKQRITEECITQTTKQEVESDLPFSVEKVSLEKIESTQDQQSDKVDYGKIAFPGKLIIPDFSENNRSKATQEQPQSLKVNKINAEQWITQTIQHEVPKTEELPQTNKLSVEKMQFLQNKETEKMETAYVSSPG